MYLYEQLVRELLTHTNTAYVKQKHQWPVGISRRNGYGKGHLEALVELCASPVVLTPGIPSRGSRPVKDV